MTLVQTRKEMSSLTKLLNKIHQKKSQLQTSTNSKKTISPTGINSTLKHSGSPKIQSGSELRSKLTQRTILLELMLREKVTGYLSSSIMTFFQTYGVSS